MGSVKYVLCVCEGFVMCGCVYVWVFVIVDVEYGFCDMLVFLYVDFVNCGLCMCEFAMCECVHVWVL